MIKNNKAFQKLKHNSNSPANIRKKINLQTIDFDIAEQIL